MKSLAPIPSRRAYPYGGLREITRGESTLFQQHLAALLAAYPLSSDPRPGWIIFTDFGTLLVHKPLVPHPHKLYYYVNMAFQNAEGLARAATGLPYARGALNPYSGKWNILLAEGSDVFDELCARLQAVNARPMAEREALA